MLLNAVYETPMTEMPLAFLFGCWGFGVGVRIFCNKGFWTMAFWYYHVVPSLHNLSYLILPISLDILGKEENVKEEDKAKPDFGLSGKLADDTNTFRGIVVKYNEPPEARKPKLKWRLYPFKGKMCLLFT